MKLGGDNTWPIALYMISAIVSNMLPMYVNVFIDVCERTFSREAGYACAGEANAG